MLKQIFKPKWQHHNAEVRKEGIEALDPADTETLLEVARTDPESQLRCLAVRKLHDMDVLANLVESANHWEVKQLAQQNFQQLFAGLKEGAPPLETRLARLDKTDDEVLLEYLAKEGSEAELRLAVLNKVGRDPLCGDMAINDPLAQNRLTAVEKITGKATLERVVEQARNRDKRVYRIAKERLDAILEVEERPKRLHAQRETLCKRLETLYKTGNWRGVGAELETIAKQWAEFEGEPDPELSTRFQTLRQQIDQAREEYQIQQSSTAKLQVEKQEALAPLQSLWEDLKDQETVPAETLHGARATLQSQQEAWQGIAKLDDAEQEQALQQTFKHLHGDLDKHLEQLARNNSLYGKLNGVCNQMEKLLRNNAPISKQRPKEFEKRWQSVYPAQAKAAFVHTLNNRFNSALQNLRKRHEEQQAHRQEVIDSLRENLGNLEKLLEEGALQKALPLEEECKKQFASLTDLPQHQHHSLEKRLHDTAAQVTELRSWQRWGNKRERELLCESMEALIDSQEDPEILAKQVQELQQEWQHLKEIDQSHALWQRFHRASQAAYAPCKTYFEARSRERRDNKTKRESLCVQLENFIAETFENPTEDEDTRHLNWKKIHQQAQQMRKEWFNIGPTNRKARKEISVRFDEAMDRLDAHLEPERERNLRQRRNLVVKAEALADEKDLFKAVEDAKKLQKEWHISVPGSRKEERELWKAFRGACDQVFARRDEARDAEHQELDANQQAKTAICEELENFIAAGGDALHSTPARIQNAEDAWSHIGPVPHKAVKGLEKRFSKACRRAEDAYNAWLAGRERSLLDLLRDKAALCSRLEHADPAQAGDILAEAEAAWNDLPALEKSDEQVVSTRFQQAREAAAAGQVPMAVPEALQQQQEILCIRLEIIAGIDSPPESAQARMAYQVERLSRAMGGDKPLEEDGGGNEVHGVERAWYRSGPCAPALEERFARAVRAFYAEAGA